jgi:hypothetical protein
MNLPTAPRDRTGMTKAGLAVNERRRLVMLGVGFFVLLGILVSTWMQARSGGAAPAPVPLADESVPAEPLLAVPELDRAHLESLVQDRAEADQVVLPSAAADLLMGVARRYTPRHYAELDAPELDAERSAALAADPAAARGQPFTARGRIVGLRARSGAAREEQFLGKLELEDGSPAHFLVLSVPEHAADVGGFVRVDGLFLKLYRTEDELVPGTWSAGPLLVGTRAVRSYPDLGTATALGASAFDDLVDAELAPDPGEEVRLVYETPAEPLYALMALARDLPADAVDWAAAPVLDQRLLDQILEDPEAFRAAPIVVPISRLQDGRVRAAGENPARLERFTQGWIANVTWRNVIQFRTPVLRPDLVIGDLVYGRGFFLQNLAYESSERGIRVAPVFVLQTLERHVPQPSVVLTRIPWVLAGMGLFLLVLFVALARRDRRRSAEFYGEIVRRRRARRERKGDVGTAAP